MKQKKNDKKEFRTESQASSEKKFMKTDSQSHPPMPQDLYRLIADLSYNWEYLMSPDRSFVYVSPSCKKITGYSDQEFMDDPDLINQIVHPDDRDKVLHHLNCINSDPIHKPFDFRIISKAGEIHWISHTCCPVLDKDGNLIGRRASNQDATDKGGLEQRLYRRETLFRTLFENTNSCIAVYTMSEDGRGFLFKEINKAAEESSQLKRKDVIGKNVEDVFPSVGRMGLLDVFRRVCSTGVAEHHPISKYSDDRIDIYVENYVYKLPGGEIVAIYHDKTAEKKAEEELRISRERMQLAIDSVSDALWDWSIHTGRAYFSPRYFTMLGYEPDEFKHSLESWEKLIHHEDLPKVKELIAKAIQCGDQYEIEFRMKRKDDSWHWVLGRGRIVETDENGSPIRMVGTHVDINERMQFESRLKLNQKAFDEAIEGVVVTDSEGRILSTNKAFTTITGYSAEEALGQNPRILKSDHHEPEFYKGLWDSLINNEVWRGEIWNRRKNGEAYPQWTSITAVKSRYGINLRYVAVFHDLSDIRRGEEMIHHQTYHDGLTDLPNRKLLTEHLRQVLEQMAKTGEYAAAIVLDLDDFKSVNNIFGHLAGDSLLQEVATRIVDFHGHKELCCRLGADAFLIVQPGLKSPTAASVTAESLNRIFEEPFKVGAEPIHLSASLGIAVSREDSEDLSPGTLIQNADIACRRAKMESRGKYRFFTQSMNSEATKRMSLLNNLRLAIQNDEIVTFFQPKVKASSNQILGMEALVRWVHNGRIISPLAFIPLAEESGLIIPIGQMVLEFSCKRIRHWREVTGRDLKVAVNVSPRQFSEDDMSQLVKDVLGRTDLPAAALELEITESVLMQNPERSQNTLEELRDIGVTIALDDFGTGYSSLSYLRQFPIDVIKIDKSFIDGVPDQNQANTLVRAIVDMAHGLGLEVVAEGVETRSQLDFLCQIRTDCFQGYYFSKPLPADEMDVLL
ncbi:MAG TPA: hypothetical protein DHV36_00395 [Desulfobacteraceae bacterium]|nr:hypothetical protein [Desulfobacteraceae bacterium]